MYKLMPPAFKDFLDHEGKPTILKGKRFYLCVETKKKYAFRDPLMVEKRREMMLQHAEEQHRERYERQYRGRMHIAPPYQPLNLIQKPEDPSNE